MSSVVEVLVAMANPDPRAQQSARQTIDEAVQADLGSFMTSLLAELNNEDQDSAIRQSAAVVMKNSVAFDARDADRRAALEGRWWALADAVRHQIKADLVVSLGTPDQGTRHLLANLVASFARLELARDQWPELIPQLAQGVSSGQPEFMHTGLTTLGYICEDCDGNTQLTNAMAQHAGEVLGAVFNGLHCRDASVQLNAATALTNSIDFIGHYMNAEEERTQLINGIVDALTGADPATQTKLLQSLVVIARLYYEKLHTHMEHLWNVTTTAIANESADDGPALQGLEFWIAIAEVEGQELPADAPHNQHYISFLKDKLWEMVCVLMQQQEAGQCEETWNKAAAAAKLLSAMADCLHDDITTLTSEFIMANFQSSDWRAQEAAILAFGTILHAPEPGTMRDAVQGATPMVFDAIFNGPNPLVRDTAAWALSVIAAEFSDMLLAKEFIEAVMDIVQQLLNSPDASLACRGASVLHNLVLYYDDDEDENDEVPPTNEISPYYEQLVQSVLGLLSRDVSEANIHHDAQEALNRLFGAAAPDCYGILTGLVPTLLGRLNDVTAAAKQAQTVTIDVEVTQGLLVGAITHIVRKVRAAILPQLSQIVSGLEHMFKCSREGTVLSEGIMCVGALGLALKAEFLPYMSTMNPYIMYALGSTEQDDLCCSALAAVADLASGLGSDIAPMLEETMQHIGGFLSNFDEDVDRFLRPPMIQTTADICLHGTGAVFQQSLDPFVTVLQNLDAEARALLAKGEEYLQPDDLDYIAELYDAILTFGTSAVQGFALTDLTPLMPHLEYLLDVLLYASQMLNNDTDVVRGAASLVGDMANVLRYGPPEFIPAAQEKLLTSNIKSMIAAGQQWSKLDAPAVVQAVDWASAELDELARAA